MSEGSEVAATRVTMETYPRWVGGEPIPGPTRCRVWQGGEMVFDGCDHTSDCAHEVAIDDEEFCPKCAGGLTSSQHLVQCEYGDYSAPTQALLGIAEAAESLMRLIDDGKYLLRADLQRAEWSHIASIARHALNGVAVRR